MEAAVVPPIRPGELLLRTELTGVCGTDVHIYHGELPGIEYPLVLGHEPVGIIEQLGDAARQDATGEPVEVGDRIIVMPATPDEGGYEYVTLPGPIVNFAQYDVTGFTPNRVRPHSGGFGQVIHLTNPRTRFFKTDLPPEIAVLAEPFATPIHGVQRVGVAPGACVLVQGTGAIGLLAIAAAITAGATQVIAVGGPPARLEIARAFGADVLIDISEVRDAQERVRLVREHTVGRRGVDVAIECAGVPSAIKEGIACLRKGGRYCELGHFSDLGEVSLNPFSDLLMKDITLVGSSGYSSHHFYQGIRLLERRAFPYELLVTHRLPLERLGEVMQAMTTAGGWTLDGRVIGKATIAPNG